MRKWQVRDVKCLFLRMTSVLPVVCKMAYRCPSYRKVPSVLWSLAILHPTVIKLYIVCYIWHYITKKKTNLKIVLWGCFWYMCWGSDSKFNICLSLYFFSSIGKSQKGNSGFFFLSPFKQMVKLCLLCLLDASTDLYPAIVKLNP